MREKSACTGKIQRLISDPAPARCPQCKLPETSPECRADMRAVNSSDRPTRIACHGRVRWSAPRGVHFRVVFRARAGGRLPHGRRRTCRFRFRQPVLQKKRVAGGQVRASLIDTRNWLFSCESDACPLASFSFPSSYSFFRPAQKSSAREKSRFCRLGW